jgi:hypothetical protein
MVRIVARKRHFLEGKPYAQPQVQIIIASWESKDRKKAFFMEK